MVAVTLGRARLAHRARCGSRPGDPALRTTLEQHVQSPAVRGVRHIVALASRPGDQPDRSTRLDVVAGMALGVRADARRVRPRVRPAGLPGPGSGCGRVDPLHPGVRVVVEHGLMPADQDPPALRRWRSGLSSLAALDQVDIKVSGLAMFDHQWTPATIEPFVAEILRSIPDRHGSCSAATSRLMPCTVPTRRPGTRSTNCWQPSRGVSETPWNSPPPERAYRRI